MMTAEELKYVQKLEVTVAEQDKLISELKEHIAELERRLNMNSTNSSTPPSKDGFKRPKKRSLRQPSEKKPGGQAGHKGNGLSLPHDPDEVIICQPKECAGCPNASVCVGRKAERRYVIDAEVSLRVREYAQMEFSCPRRNGDNLYGEFPENITATKQYGNTLKALVVALNTEGAVSVKRTHDILCALTGVPVSTGFIHNTLRAFANGLEKPLEYIKGKLLNAPVLHADETGLRVDGSLAWLHSASNELYTYQGVSNRRGKQGIAEVGLLPLYTGTLIHDCWAAYWSLAAKCHGICLAHILRELNGIIENFTEHNWAEGLKTLLMEMKEAKDKLIAKGKTEASRYYIRKFKEDWDLWIWSGQHHNPIEEAEDTGRTKRNKARCLVDRLKKYEEAVWLFFRDFSVPFDNNQAERDVRPAKTKMKVSGSFVTVQPQEKIFHNQAGNCNFNVE